MSRRRASEPFDAARTEALWARQVESGANTAAFCATEGLDVRTYNRWKGQLMARRSEQRSEQTSPAASPKLVDVTALLTPQAAGAVEVILLDGIRLRITPDFDPTTLRRVVEALR
jgi:hypothetical protein